MVFGRLICQLARGHGREEFSVVSRPPMARSAIAAKAEGERCIHVRRSYRQPGLAARPPLVPLSATLALPSGVESLAPPV